jgi:diaminopimelate epimerase
MSTLRFHKYEGIGNDFVLIDGESAALVDPAGARRLCDRHFGIGADGVLLVTSATSAAASARMIIFNADGSRAEMCGNGLRCVALHLARIREESRAEFVVDTDTGPLECDVDRDGDVAHVLIGLGAGSFVGDHTAQFDGKAVQFLRVSMGNPHAVTFGTQYTAAEIDHFAPQLSATFPEGSNVEFANVIDPHTIELVVWERGVGRTLACGTGAAATVVAAAVRQRVPFGEKIEVRLPGGPLQIAVQEEGLGVELRGPARRVFSGEVPGW